MIRKAQYNICLILFLTLSSITLAKPTIIHNIKGYSLTQDSKVQFQAIAFENDMILKTGNYELLTELFPDSEIIDGQGKTMLPALQDSMVHLQRPIQDKLMLDLSHTKSKQEVLNTIKKHAKEYPDDKWIKGFGWDYTQWKNKSLPTSKDLDDLEIKKNIYLLSKDYRVVWLNKFAINKTRIMSLRDSPFDGLVLVDEQKKHTGIYVDSAINYIEDNLQVNRPQEFYHSMLESLNKIASNGLGTIVESEIEFKPLNIIKSFLRQNKLPVRVNSNILYSDHKFKWSMKYTPYHDEQMFLHTHDIKYILKDRFLAEGYNLPLRPDNNHDIIVKMIEDNLDNNWQASFQVNNEKELANALNILNNIEIGDRNIRNKLEFSKTFTTKQFPKQKNPLVLAMQPEMILKALKTNQSGKLSGWQNLQNKNIKLVVGSNYPYSDSINPFAGLHKLVNPPQSSEKLSRVQALSLYTLNSAYANRQENYLGNLEADKLADFILIDNDYFEVKSSEIKNINVLETWVGGRKVFDSSEGTNPTLEK